MIEKAENDCGGAERSPREGLQRDLTAAPVRSAPLAEWTIADQAAWQRAIAPRARLRKGGAGGHLAAITQRDLARRYGYFVDHLIRKGLFDPDAGPAAQVIPDLVVSFVEELGSRVSSVTTAGSICKLRRASELLDPDRDFAWLAEIEKDLALVMRPKSKDNRLVDPDLIVEAGLTLIKEASDNPALTPLQRGRQVRDGLMIALLALCPIRLKNFAALELQASFRRIGTRWWIVLDRNETKSGGARTNAARRATSTPPSKPIFWITARFWPQQIRGAISRPSTRRTALRIRPIPRPAATIRWPESPDRSGYRPTPGSV